MLSNVKYCNSLLKLFRFQSMRQLNSIQAANVDYFKSILGPNRVKQTDLEKYNRDWLGLHEGKSNLCLVPSTTEDVSKILSYCNDNHLQLVVQGGNTNVVAGSVPDDDEIIISMEAMNKIIEFNDTTGVLTCQPGVILETAESFVNEKGYMMPYDLGAKSSCQVGGNIASNAGGIRYVRYGSLHGSVLGLEAVKADGTILNMMSTLRKDNTGYDLKQLFIGSEGTLGVITKASILCPVKPMDKVVALLGVSNYEASVKLLKIIRSKFVSYLSAYELMDETTMDAVHINLNYEPPFKAPFYVLFEISIFPGSNEEVIRDNLTSFLDTMISDEGLVNDAVLSTDLTSYGKLWAMREQVMIAIKAEGEAITYDVSLEHKDYYRIIEIMRDHLANKKDLIRVSGLGHLADNNIHLIISSKSFTREEVKSIETLLHKWVGERNGSISAEHGLGMKKRNLIYYSKPREVVDLMKQMKQLFDPNNILNPKKLLPDN